MADTQAFLVEIGTEELPPKNLQSLAVAFHQNIFLGLSDNSLFPNQPPEGETYFSPRRLAIYMPEILLKQKDRTEERLGPAVSVSFDNEGQTTKAAEGFAKSCGVTVSQLEHRKTEKGERLAYTLTLKGKTAAELLPVIVSEALAKLPILKRMRWGMGTVEFVRPVHWVVMLLGSRTLKAEILGVRADNKTYGHRYMHPMAITLKHPKDYHKTLATKGKVLVEDRVGTLAKKIGTLVNQSAKRAHGQAQLDPALLEEVAALVEWPVPVTGSFDDKFLALPDEVIVAVLETQQRYFPLRDNKGKLLPKFVAISNIQSKRPAEVRRGNERVIVPRLTDAMFFWNNDSKTRLEARLPELDRVVFQKGLGSYGDKSRRVGKLAAQIASEIGGDPKLAERAGRLCKCDLVTGMVGEFPELQGIMGGYYARHDGEPEEVARAIAEHYRPRFAGDALPETRTGQALTIADKLDTIIGIFTIGQKPTGEKDPFALRRQALGVLRIIIENKLAISLAQLIINHIQAFATKGVVNHAANIADLSAEIDNFFTERFRALVLETGMRADVINAVLANANPTPLDAWGKIEEIQSFLGRQEAHRLIMLFKRCANILRQAKSLGYGIPDLGDSSALTTDEERALDKAVRKVGDKVIFLVNKNRAYREALETILSLEKPLATFFEAVMVMADDVRLRDARLGLVLGVYTPMKNIADFSLVQVDV